MTTKSLALTTLLAVASLGIAFFGARRLQTSPVAQTAVSAAPAQGLPLTGSAPEAQPRAPAGEVSFLGKTYRVLEARQELPEPSGRFKRVFLVDSKSELGLLRLESTNVVDPASRQERTVQQEAFVAGDLIVTPAPTLSAEQRTSTFRALGAVAWSPIYGSGQWLLKFPTPSLATVPDALARAGALPSELLDASANGVGNGGFIPDDDRFSNQYSFLNYGQFGGVSGADVRATAAWDEITTSPNVTVAVLDSGIDLTHPDLVDNLYTDPNEIAGNHLDDDHNGFIDDVHGWNFVANTASPADDLGHGTHVSGTLGASGNNHFGVAGITWKVRILPVKILNASNSGTTANLIAGLNYARLKGGVNVMNLSLQNYPYNTNLLAAIKATEDAGILLVICAGNNGTDNDTSPNYPSSYANANILAVANTNSSDQLHTGTYPSDYGATRVDLAAPGVDILSTLPGATYGYYTGTSMSTPHVAGVAALLLALHPDATVAQLREWILSTVDPLPSLQGKCVSGGRLNAAAALRAATPLPVISSGPTTQNAENGSSVIFGVSAQSLGATSYQWYVDGNAIGGATQDTLTLNNVSHAHAGAYTVLVSNASGTKLSAPAQLTVSTPGANRLINLSIRTNAGADDQTLIAGFVVTGGNLPLLLRGIGPGLDDFHVAGFLTDPLLSLYQMTPKTLLTYNDDWGQAANASDFPALMSQAGGFPLHVGSRDSVLVQTLGANGYSALCGPATGSQGIALVELYALDKTGAARLANVSARAQVGTGDNILIGGFVVDGTEAKTLLVRGIGPTLTAFSVGGVLEDPVLTVIASSDHSVVAQNDNWNGTVELQANFAKAGAFPLPAASKDAALLVTVPPGSYTAQVSGVGGTTGVALIEIYEVR